MSLTFGIVGASGAVGEELLKVIGEFKDALKVKDVKLFASARSCGKILFSEALGGELTIEEFSLDKVIGINYVFLAVSGEFSRKYAAKIAESGSVVIDNSSAFRYDDKVPLVIPEINGQSARDHALIANPNCTTAISAMALWPLHKKFGLRKLILSTYQAASGAGAEGVSELKAQAAAFVNEDPIHVSNFQHQLLFNVIPHIDTFMENGYTKEEMKVVWEMQKIFGSPDIDISCTCVRIPVLRAHSVAVSVETVNPCTPEEARECIGSGEGVCVKDDPKSNTYPMPLFASNRSDVECGRIRRNLIFGDNGLDLFVCGDQLLRGAALNAVLIAKYLIK